MAWKRRAAWALVAIAGGTLAVRYTPLLDPDPKDSPKMADLAARFHPGGGPCIRYTEGAPPAEKLDAAAARLHAAGVESETVGGLVGAFYLRAREQERAQHALSEEDEWVAAITEASSGPRRLAMGLKRDRLREVLAQMLHVEVPVRLQLGDVAPKQREAIEAVWKDDASVLMVSGLVPLIKALRGRETTARLDAIARLLAAAKPVPGTLEELGLPPDELRDGWDAPIEYERREDRLIVTALRDGAPDVREIPIAAGAVAPPPPCPAPGEVTLARSAIDAALDDTAALSGSARVVPSLKNGEVVGFRFFAIRPGSLLAQAGLCNGDVVKAINGHSLASPEKALELYALVRKASALDVAIERQGSDASLKVLLR